MYVTHVSRVDVFPADINQVQDPTQCFLHCQHGDRNKSQILHKKVTMYTKVIRSKPTKNLLTGSVWAYSNRSHVIGLALSGHEFDS